MRKEELSFRWLHASCYELKLPDGRIITIDPYVLPIGYPNFTEDSYTTPDYVLITHTHFDHILDIPVVMGKNPEARLYIGAQGAIPLGEKYDLLFGQICILENGDEISHGGLRLKAFRGKHSRFISREKERMSNCKLAGVREHGIEGFDALNYVGSVEYSDFLITTPDNFRIFITGGDAEHTIPYDVARDYCPNLLIRQASNFHTPEEYAQCVARYNAQYVLPHHQEFAEKRLGMPMEEFARRVQAELDRLGSPSQFIDPEQFEWYSFSCSIEKK